MILFYFYEIITVIEYIKNIDTNLMSTIGLFFKFLDLTKFLLSIEKLIIMIFYYL